MDNKRKYEESCTRGNTLFEDNLEIQEENIKMQNWVDVLEEKSKNHMRETLKIRENELCISQCTTINFLVLHFYPLCHHPFLLEENIKLEEIAIGNNRK